MVRSLSACSLAVALLVGCAGPSAQLQTENERLEERVSALRAEKRAQRRTIRDLENQLALLRDHAQAARVGGGADVPELPIEVREPSGERSETGGPQEFAASGAERLDTGAGGASGPEPDAEPRAAEEDDDEEIIVLSNIPSRTGGGSGSARRERARGSGAESRQRRSEQSRSGQSSSGQSSSGQSSSGQSSSRAPGPRADAPLPVVRDRLPDMGGEVPSVSSRLDRDSEQAKREPRDEYRRYLEALRAGNHAFAAAGFRNFIDEFSQHPLADNAQYWLAETYYDQDEFETALDHFRRVVSDFPGGNKVPDALLKIGYCHVKMGDDDAARRVLTRVLERYGDTNPAELAERKLETLDAPPGE